MLTDFKHLFSKNKILLTGKILIALTAYIYILFRILRDIDVFNQDLIVFRFSLQGFYFMVICLFLMPINWLLESIKWKMLIRQIESISILQSLKGVLFGLTCAVFTPYRLGELAGRPMMLSPKSRIPGIMAAFVGSIAQSIITIGMGGVGLIFLILDEKYQNKAIFQNTGFIEIATLIIFIVLLFTYFHPNIFILLAEKIKFLRKWVGKFAYIREYSIKELVIILLLGQIRYIIFFLQYFVLLLAFNIEISLWQAFSAISMSYLFLFTIPGIPIAEPGIRGSLALFFIGIYSDNNIAILAASMGLWVINLAFPSLIGSVIIFKSKRAI